MKKPQQVIYPAGALGAGVGVTLARHGFRAKREVGETQPPVLRTHNKKALIRSAVITQVRSGFKDFPPEMGRAT
jgi:hypothetical protein